MPDRTPSVRGLGRVYNQNRESSKSRNISDARKLLQQRLGEIAKGSFVARDVERTSVG